MIFISHNNTINIELCLLQLGGLTMDKKVMSISEQVKYLKILNGIMWILIGVFDIFDGIVCSIITAVLLIIAIIFIKVVWNAEKEDDDELSYINRLKASDDTLRIMNIVFFIMCSALLLLRLVSIISIKIPWEKLIVPMFFIVIGIKNIIWGICFKKYEEE